MNSSCKSPSIILNKLEEYLFRDGKYTRSLDGNYLIGQGRYEDTEVEIRYSNNKYLFKQILIDDIWSENMIWGDYGFDGFGRKKIIIYLCHEQINIEKKEISIDSKLNMSQYFKAIKKYFVHLPPEILVKYSQYVELFNQKVISSPSKRQKEELEKPIISIIITVLNNALQLEQTIQSVINQSYQEFEYVIKDGGSTDGFEDIIQKYSGHIDIIESFPDKGIFSGMDDGIKLSNGEYFAFLNSDDIFYSENVLQTYIENIKESNSDAYYANIFRRNENGKVILRRGSVKNLYRESSINHPTLYLKREWYDKVGGFDMGLKYAADGDLTIKLLKAGCRLSYIDRSMVLFRVGGASTFSWSLIKEDMICRYRYGTFNIKGYIYILLRTLKYLIVVNLKNK